MDVGTGVAEVAQRVLAHVDLERAVELVQEVCRIPSVLGEEGALAAFLASTMRESGFDDVELQPVLPGPAQRDRARSRSGPGRRWCSPATWTRSPCRTAGASPSRSRAR